MVKKYHPEASHKTIVFLLSVIACGCIMPPAGCDEPNYKIAAEHIVTKWAFTVRPDSVHTEYPRPQMVRQEWQNLNGLWDYAICAKDMPCPGKFDGKILVPFCVESALSGVGRQVGKDSTLWYRREFKIPSGWKEKKILLHFGAVDWSATVWVNGIETGTHKGGYDPFSFDITDAIKEKGKQEIVVSVWDPIDAGTQPRGKQVTRPGAIWYTSVTGIWQSVWLEPVPKAYIESFKITTDVDKSRVQIEVVPNGVNPQTHLAEKYFVRVYVLENGKEVGSAMGHFFSKPFTIAIPNAKLWNPGNPYLYDLKIILQQEDREIDSVESYFGMRKISLGKDSEGITRIFLNNKPLFQYGPLDQGWWPDGLYTSPADDALRYDIEVAKKLGCNMIRKHVKAEPARFYYWCDKLGMLVWQDMPSGDRYIGAGDADIERTEESGRQFETELKAMIDYLYNQPCIVMWVPFNEGWGQWNTERITRMVKEYDPTRLVNSASGWTGRGTGDVHDIHSYPGPSIPKLEEGRAAVLGEFGGLGLPIRGHTWQDEKNWGYQSFESTEELTDAYLNLVSKLRLLIAQGLSAAVYTQTTDVEIEINGWLTYDRAILKMDENKVSLANRKLYLPPLLVETVEKTN